MSFFADAVAGWRVGSRRYVLTAVRMPELSRVGLASHAEVIATLYRVRTARGGLMDWWIVALIVVAIFGVDAAYRRWLKSGQR